MSKLPQLKQVETFTAPVVDQVLTFRKTIISDSLILENLRKTLKESPIEGMLEMLANLMEGYDEPVEERLKFLKSIECPDYSKLNDQITEILMTAGVSQREIKDDKKKAKDNLKK